MREIEPSVPDWFERIVRKLHAKQATDRPQTASEVADLLEQCLAHVRQPAITPLPSSIPAAGIQRSRFDRWRGVLVATGVLFMMFFAGVFIVLELDKGQLTIESVSDDIPIRVVQSDKTVEKLQVSKSGAKLRIAAGKYEVEIDGEFEGMTIEGGTVTLLRGGSEKVRIVRSTATSDPSEKVTAVDRAVDFLQKNQLGASDDFIYRRSAIDIPKENSIESRWYKSALAKVWDFQIAHPSWHYSTALIGQVDEFNARLLTESPDHNQPPLTVAELETCASWSELHNDKISKSAKEGLHAIAQTHQWPEGWQIQGGLKLASRGSMPFVIELVDDQNQHVVEIRRRFLTPPEEFRQPSVKPLHEGMPLRTAVSDFNDRSDFPNGLTQPPLTEDEVLACIASLNANSRPDVPIRTIERFQEIARTHMIPSDSSLEVLSKFGTEGKTVHTIWSIRLRMPILSKPGFTTAFTIREQYIAIEHGDATKIQWGTPGENGMQAGVRLSPPNQSFDLGQTIGVEFFYRNVYARPLQGMLPNVFRYQAMEAIDADGKKVLAIHNNKLETVGGWMATHFGDSPIESRGPSFVVRSKEDNYTVLVADLVSGSGQQTVLIVKPGQRLRIGFTVSNPADGEQPDLKTGMVEFSIHPK